MKKIIKLIMVFVAIGIFANLVGCVARTADYRAMVVTPNGLVNKNPKLRGMIYVGSVSGGSKTNPLWVSKVDDSGFKKALENSLTIYGYLANSSAKAKYTLDVHLTNLKQPMVGFDMNVESVVMYKLYGHGVNNIYTIKAVGKAKVADAFFGFERVKVANERSIQENIAEFIQRLNVFSTK